jgi:hypothetical protein
MKVVAAISSPAQDDVIKRILEHIGCWQPPWKRIRKARGPPEHRPPTAPYQERAIEATDSIDPQWDLDSTMADPPAPEDL